MNPLTIKARHNVNRQAREDNLVLLFCSVVTLAMFVAFVL